VSNCCRWTPAPDIVEEKLFLETPLSNLLSQLLLLSPMILHRFSGGFRLVSFFTLSNRSKPPGFFFFLDTVFAVPAHILRHWNCTNSIFPSFSNDSHFFLWSRDFAQFYIIVTNNFAIRGFSFRLFGYGVEFFLGAVLFFERQSHPYPLIFFSMLQLQLYAFPSDDEVW